MNRKTRGQKGRHGRPFWQTSLVMALIFAALLGSVYGVAQSVVTRGFDAVERKEARENALRVRYVMRAGSKPKTSRC